jgi:hypothetical protein
MYNALRYDVSITQCVMHVNLRLFTASPWRGGNRCGYAALEAKSIGFWRHSRQNLCLFQVPELRFGRCSTKRGCRALVVLVELVCADIVAVNPPGKCDPFGIEQGPSAGTVERCSEGDDGECMPAGQRDRG